MDRVTASVSKRKFLVFLVFIILSSSFLKKSLIEDELPILTENIASKIKLELMPRVVVSSMLADDRYIQQWILLFYNSNGHFNLNRENPNAAMASMFGVAVLIVLPCIWCWFLCSWGIFFLVMVYVILR